MAGDPSSILRQIGKADEQFRNLIAYVRGPDALGATAYEVELHVLRELLGLGALLLKLFFDARTRASGPPPPAADGAGSRLHSWRPRTYLSVFGPVRVSRRYYRTESGGGVCPLDAELSLGRRCYSDLLRSWLEYAVTKEAYDEAVESLSRFLGFKIDKHALERLVEEDARDVDAFYSQRPSPAAADEGPILVAQIDGKGVRMAIRTDSGALRTEKREAVVTALYTIDPHKRRVEPISDTLAGKPADAVSKAPTAVRPVPVAKELRATLHGKDTAFEHLARSAQERDGPHIRHRVALTDGDPALQKRVHEHLPTFSLVLDAVHAAGYVRAASEAVLGEGNPMLPDYVACRLDELLGGQLNRMLDTLDDPFGCTQTLSPAEEQVVATAVRYLRRNAEYMHYDEYLAKGWPIATGVIEGAARHLVKDRMECSGMKWRSPGAQAVLDLRSVRVNGYWDDYQRFRRRREHLRIHGPSEPLGETPEETALAQAA
ncbi:MAG: ISKra4 family transposase [Dehalococcoidia bacterium]